MEWAKAEPRMQNDRICGRVMEGKALLIFDL